MKTVWAFEKDGQLIYTTQNVDGTDWKALLIAADEDLAYILVRHLGEGLSSDPLPVKLEGWKALKKAARLVGAKAVAWGSNDGWLLCCALRFMREDFFAE